MCRAISFVVTQNAVYHSENSQSHEEIKREHNLRDGENSRLAPVECHPRNWRKDKYGREEWKIVWEEKPAWYNDDPHGNDDRVYEYLFGLLKKWKGKIPTGLNLQGTGITSLPEGLKVGGSLNLQGTGITSLPEGLEVGGSLDLQGTGITSLPEGLKVGGWLDLQGTGITSLPEGLEVGGSLNLQGTGITSLPEGLKVGGYLDLQCTGITKVPKHLEDKILR